MAGEKRVRLGAGVATLLLLVMGMMWGLQFAMLKLAARSGTADITVLTITLILLSVIFVCVTGLRGEWFRLNAKILVFLVVTGVLGYVLPLLAALYAASELSAGVLTLFACMTPVVAMSVALILRTERVSLTRMAAVALGFVSVSMVLLPELDLPGQGKAVWMLAALIVPLTYGIESVYISVKWPPGLSALQVVTGEAVVAATLVVPIFLLSGEPLPDLALWTGPVGAILIFVAAGVIESLIYFYLIRETGGVFVNFGTFISLFAGIVWGIVLFSETHSTLTWIAAAALAVSLFLARKEATTVAPPPA